MVKPLFWVVCQVKSHVFISDNECVHLLAEMPLISQPPSVLPLSTLYGAVCPRMREREVRAGRAGAGIIFCCGRLCVACLEAVTLAVYTLSLYVLIFPRTLSPISFCSPLWPRLNSRFPSSC